MNDGTRILEAIRDLGSATVAEIVTQTEIPRRRVFSALGDLIVEGSVERTAGRPPRVYQRTQRKPASP